MNKIYLVLHIGPNTEVKVHNLYFDKMVALDMGYALAAEVAADYTHWLNSNPNKDALDDGSARWVFFETPKQYVGVHELTVSEKTFSPDAADDLPKLTTPIVNLVPQFPDFPVHNNATEKAYGHLPGGFNYLNEPINVQLLILDPFSALETNSLSDKQKEALVIARIRAIPNYTFTWNSGLTWTKDHTLFVISKNLEHKQTIIDFECDFVDAIRQNAIDEQSFEDESSSSSEDTW